ncbi:hypothetical protein [Aquirhabdus sp.]|uniref:hypothetical protein n=1 Tax=Aquirhabdus sp. TaxID=2824160 RepID=UPI00396C9F89
MNTKTAKKEFVDAIREKKRVKVIFYSQEQKRFLVKVCAPIDYGMSAGLDEGSNAASATESGAERLHFWDFEGQPEGQHAGEHKLSLRADQVRGINVLDEFFDPSELVADGQSSTGRSYS